MNLQDLLLFLEETRLYSAFIIGIIVLLALILRLKVNAFVALLIAAIAVGIISGMDFVEILETIKRGMGGTLGFVATVVGLGAILGELLHHSGATELLAKRLLARFGTDKAPIALSLTGFLIAIPVFFDVAFIILVPIIYALQKRTGKSLLYFAIPLLASLAVTHAFIPPTPGPIAVADIINADLGWIIFYGFIVGIPTTIVAGLLFGRYIAQHIHIETPDFIQFEKEERAPQSPNISIILGIILLPILLILANTTTNVFFPKTEANAEIWTEITPLWVQVTQFLGHPFTALIIATLLALYFLGIRLGLTKDKLQQLSMKALGPAGIIILITGAGGVFKEMLITSGAGEQLAQQMEQLSINPILLAFVLALIVRLMQGSATVAMITAAGLIAPILDGGTYSSAEMALIVLSIAAGASGFSHVNDSGFWLVNRYLGMDEKQTFQSWTTMTGILSLTALTIILVLSWMV